MAGNYNAKLSFHRKPEIISRSIRTFWAGQILGNTGYSWRYGPPSWFPHFPKIRSSTSRRTSILGGSGDVSGGSAGVPGGSAGVPRGVLGGLGWWGGAGGEVGLVPGPVAPEAAAALDRLASLTTTNGTFPHH